jgi:hypothetical protein
MHAECGFNFHGPLLQFQFIWISVQDLVSWG